MQQFNIREGVCLSIISPIHAFTWTIGSSSLYICDQFICKSLTMPIPSAWDFKYILREYDTSGIACFVLITKESLTWSSVPTVFVITPGQCVKTRSKQLPDLCLASFMICFHPYSVAKSKAFTPWQSAGETGVQSLLMVSIEITNKYERGPLNHWERLRSSIEKGYICECLPFNHNFHSLDVRTDSVIFLSMPWNHHWIWLRVHLNISPGMRWDTLMTAILLT